jgi:hypothetical protein
MNKIKKVKYELLVILFFILTRLPSLGHDNFTTDTWKWKSRSYDFGSGVFGLDFQKTLQKYHPGVTLMWIGATGIKIYNASYNLLNKTDPPNDVVSTVFELDFVQKFLTVLTIAIGLAFVFYPIRKIFGLKNALLLSGLVSFEPYYVALTRVFHLEGLLSIFMLASVTWLFWFIDEGGNKKLIISAVFAGLSILTKTTALFLLPFTLMMITFYYLTQKGIEENIIGLLSSKLKFLSLFKKILLSFALWFVVLSAVVFCLWPALWVDPKGVYNAIYKGVAVVGIEREHIQYYFGKLVDDPGPTFYPIVFLYKSSPWVFLGFFGALFFIGKFSTRKKKFILFLICYSLLYLLMLTLPTKKLDRYIMPSLVSLAAVSSFFYLWVWDSLKIKSIFKFILVSVPVLATLILIHPDYLSYYNPISGGLKTGVSVLEPKWFIGEREVIKYFEQIQKLGNYQKSEGVSIEKLISEKKVNNVLIVAFQEKYYTQIWPFFREIGAWGVIEDISAQSRYAQYFVYPVWEDLSKSEIRFKLEYDGSIYVRGVEIYRVYRRL